MVKKKTFYITTPIYYPSNNMHLGNTYTTIICDIMRRYKELCGYDTYFLTGTDEHGQKIQTKADELGITPQQFVDNIVANTKCLWSKLNITNDDFIRTTQIRHIETVKKVFSKLLKQGDIYLDQYEGWYCKDCEAFFTKSQLKDDKCPDCGKNVTLEKEEAYFLKVSKYTTRLIKFYEDNPTLVRPQSRLNEIISNFIKPGLEDLCVSRTSVKWGIQVDENPKHTVYVWIDALLNYISALGYLSENDSLYQKYWVNGDEIIHVLGKEITRFHLIYWPIVLMALNLKMPSHLYCHGWIIMKDGKMSKSVGNVVYPLPLKNEYGIDSVRFFSTRGIRFFEDGIFSPELFVERFNTDLVNDYGNLTHRSLSMINKYFDGNIPEYKGSVTEFDKALEQLANQTYNDFVQKMNDFDISNAVNVVFNYISAANKYIDDTKPWVLAKDESKIEDLKSVMSHLANVIYQASILLKPILIEGVPKILSMLNVPQELCNYQSASTFGVLQNVKIVEKPTPVYLRLDAAVEIEKMENILSISNWGENNESK